MKRFIAIFILGFIAFCAGWYSNDKICKCVVSYDDPAASIYWEDGSFTQWFGSDFTLDPGESVTIPVDPYRGSNHTISQDALHDYLIETFDRWLTDEEIDKIVNSNGSELSTYAEPITDFDDTKLDIHGWP